MLPEDDMYGIWMDVVEDSDHLRRALVDPGKYRGNSRRVCQAGRHAVAGHFKSRACPSDVALRTVVDSRSECFPSFYSRCFVIFLG